MKILFIHQNFPGQFKHLAEELKNLGHEVCAIAINPAASIGVRVEHYQPLVGSSKNIHPLATEFETKIIRGEACANKLLKLSRDGFYPDLIIGHPGWGEMLFAREVYPKAKQIHFIEFYYQASGADVNFDPEFLNSSLEERERIYTKNAHLALSMLEMDWGYAPTQWQKSLTPEIFQNKVDVIFDGIDTDIVKPKLPSENITLKIDMFNGSTRVINETDEIITFVNRNLEPYRGYHSFIRALPEIQRQRPHAITLIAGGEGVSYGAKAPDGRTWKDIFLDEVKADIDASRVIFLGNIVYDQYIKLLQISKCHVYLTYPFVLSWSCLEAMACEALVVGSKTAPVEEVIVDRENGLLVDFFDIKNIAHTVIDVLKNPEQYQSIRKAARRTIMEKYDLKSVSIPSQLAMIEKVMEASFVPKSN